MKKKIAMFLSFTMFGLNAAASVQGAVQTRITGDAETEYVSGFEHFEVVLPTSASLNFNLDPLGLTELDPDEEIDLDQLLNRSTAGIVYSNNTLLFGNLGTKDVKVDSVIEVEGDAKLVDKDATIDGDNSCNLKLAIVPLVVGASGEEYGSKDETTSEDMSSSNAGIFKVQQQTYMKSGDADTYGVAFDDTNSSISFKIDKPKWVYKGGQTQLSGDEDDNSGMIGKAIAFTIAGECNQKADWSEFQPNGSSTISLSATFTLAATEADANDTYDVDFDYKEHTVADVDSGDRLLKIEDFDVTKAVKDAAVAPTFSDSITIDGNTGAEIAITPGSGSLAINSIDSIKAKFDGVADTDIKAETGVAISADKKKITIDKSIASKFDSTAGAKIVIGYTDASGAKKTAEVEYTVANVGPVAGDIVGKLYLNSARTATEESEFTIYLNDGEVGRALKSQLPLTFKFGEKTITPGVTTTAATYNSTNNTLKFKINAGFTGAGLINLVSASTVTEGELTVTLGNGHTYTDNIAVEVK